MTNKPRKRAAKRKPSRVPPKVKVIELAPEQAVRLVVPPDIVPVIAHDPDNRTLEIVPLKKEAAAAKQPFSILEWFFGRD